MDQQAGYAPPAPKPRSNLRTLASAILFGRRDLLSLLPESAYHVKMAKSPVGRRPIFVVNEPRLVKNVTVDRFKAFPKSDLMVGALKPLVGDGIFISNGRKWRRQRRMIDPAFAHMRIRAAFSQMVAATADFEARLDAIAAAGAPVSLDEEMSHITADIVFRAIFGEPIESDDAHAVFRAFADYQDSVTQIAPRVVLSARAWEDLPQDPTTLRQCALIRRTLGVLVDRRLAADDPGNDIAADIIAARDPETGKTFRREELIDQIAVFFLAGHETSATTLTWALFILSQQPDALARIREEAARVCGDGPIDFDHVRRLPFTRNVFREALRLYPPVSFITRIANRPLRMGPYEAPRGSLVVISPWLIHRHRRYWRNPDIFDPDRFSPAREGEMTPGAYIPFGLGPRVCSGASFATYESILILAALARRYDFETVNAGQVRPVGRLTTRPKTPVRMRFTRRG